MILGDDVPDVRRQHGRRRARQALALVMMVMHTRARRGRAREGLAAAPISELRAVFQGVEAAALRVLRRAQHVALHIVHHWRRASHALHQIRRDQPLRQLVARRRRHPLLPPRVQRLVEGRQVQGVGRSGSRLTRQRPRGERGRRHGVGGR